ncbi:hypothetical protein L7F22_021150 [Adiantum nelumboides]|nr:hypothetical protein [Adiantum nelumboides]
MQAHTVGDTTQLLASLQDGIHLPVASMQTHAMGDTSQLPTPLQDALEKLESSTAQNDGLKLSITMNYDGYHDLVQACHSIARDVCNGMLLLCNITKELLDQRLLIS